MIAVHRRGLCERLTRLETLDDKANKYSRCEEYIHYYCLLVGRSCSGDGLAGGSARRLKVGSVEVNIYTFPNVAWYLPLHKLSCLLACWVHSV